MRTLALCVIGYVASSYAVGLAVWRHRKEDRTGMSSLYLLLSPLTVPLVAYLAVKDRT